MTDPPDPLALETPEQLAAMVHRLRHDLRNAYAVSGAIALASARAAPEHHDFAAALAQRLSALAHVQARLIDHPAGAALPALAAEVIAAFAPNGAVRVGDLPELTLREQHARVVALTLAELCADSLRHGALAQGGAAELAGASGEGRMMLEWREPAGDPSPRADEEPGHRLLARLVGVHHGRFAVADEAGERVARLELPFAGE